MYVNLKERYTFVRNDSEVLENIWNDFLGVWLQGRSRARTAKLCQLQHQCRSTTIDLSG